MSSPAAAWWGSDSIGLSALSLLTSGVAGSGPYSVGTLDELYSTGDFSTCPSYLMPTEFPQVPTSFDLDGFALDGSYSNREPTTQLEHEFLTPFVYLWTDTSASLERMDSATGLWEQRLVILVRVRRDDDASLNPGGYGPSVSREFAQRQALNLARGVIYLLSRDLPQACRNLEQTGGFGVLSVLQTESPTITSNYGADGDAFADAVASVTVLQLRSEPANTGV